ncbi:MAG: hypothetical protein OHK0031_03240 [Anaerolineales bacterium]
MSAPILLGIRALAALALYAFLGWALYLIWQTLRSQASLLNAQKIPALKIRLTTPDGETEDLVFHKNELSIGRDPACELRSDDPSISARHARILYHHAQWWAEDLGSTNGSTLNDAPLNTATILIDGDTLKCGYTLIEINTDTEKNHD